MANNPPPINPVIHALADLKANMKASVFFNDAQKMVRNANSWGALTAAAHLLDSAEFEACRRTRARPRNCRPHRPRLWRVPLLQPTLEGQQRC